MRERRERDHGLDRSRGVTDPLGRLPRPERALCPSQHRDSIAGLSPPEIGPPSGHDVIGKGGSLFTNLTLHPAEGGSQHPRDWALC